MAIKKDAQNLSNPESQEIRPESPLSFKNIFAGIIVTVLGGVILAFIIQDARFSPQPAENVSAPIPTVTPIRTQSVLSTLSPNSTQIANGSTVIVNIEEDNTLFVYDGKIFISVNFVNIGETISATIGSPGCANQEIKEAHIGYAVIYECDNKFDIRVGSIKSRDTWSARIWSVDFYVTELEK